MLEYRIVTGIGGAVAGIVLAGGRSRRMGADKRLLRIGGETLLQRAVRIVSEAAAPVYLAAEEPAVPGTVHVSDEVPNAGPLAGLAACLSRAGDGAHVCAACDLPLLKPGVLRLLLRLAEGWEGAVPVIGGHAEPLCAVYRGGCADLFRSELVRGERSIQRLLPRLELRRVTEEELRQEDPELLSFLNANTPEDWRRILALAKEEPCRI